ARPAGSPQPPRSPRRSREPRRHPAESLNPVNLACLANVWYSVGLGGGGLMQALSVPQPWAWAIARGHKTHLNHAANTSYRGPLAIYASCRAETRYVR